jgi:hypothetical protein
LRDRRDHGHLRDELVGDVLARDARARDLDLQTDARAWRQIFGRRAPRLTGPTALSSLVVVCRGGLCSNGSTAGEAVPIRTLHNQRTPPDHLRKECSARVELIDSWGVGPSADTPSFFGGERTM